MYFIYSLSVDGIIFYIGITKRPLGRYKEHYHDNLSKAYDITRYLLVEHNKVCEMNVLYTVCDKCHIWAERRVIELYSKKYHLINNDCPYRWRNMLGQIKKVNTKDILQPYMQRLQTQINKLCPEQ